MIRRAVSALLLAATAAGFAPATALPVATPIQCIAHDFSPRCGYRAEGPGRLWSFRAGPWVARVIRGTQTIWTFGGSFATTMIIPAEPGDKVEIQIILPTHCELPVTGTPQPACEGTGAVFATEGGPEIPYLP